MSTQVQLILTWYSLDGRWGEFIVSLLAMLVTSSDVNDFSNFFILNWSSSDECDKPEIKSWQSKLADRKGPSIKEIHALCYIYTEGRAEWTILTNTRLKTTIIQFLLEKLTLLSVIFNFRQIDFERTIQQCKTDWPPNKSFQWVSLAVLVYGVS